MPKKEISWKLKARDSVTGVLRKVRRRFKAFAGGIGKIAKRMAIGVGVVGASLAALAVKGQEFRKQIALIRTMSGIPFATLSKQIRSMSAEFGQTKEAIASGIYDALSAGVPRDNVFEFVRVASKAAVGGATDTAVSVDALTSVMNAYGMAASDAAHISDVLFSIVKDGKIRYSELAANIGKLAPTAKAAGMSLQDLAAFTAALVKVEKPERAFTALRSSMMIAAEQGKTLHEVLQGLEGASIGEILAAGFERETAGSLSILAGNMDSVRHELEQMRDTAGEAGRAFDQFDKANLLDRLWQSLSGITAVLGDVTLELFESSMRAALDLATKISDEIAKWKESDAFKNIKRRVDGILSALNAGGKDGRAVWAATADLIKVSLAEGGKSIARKLLEVAPKVGRILAESIKPGGLLDSWMGKGKQERYRKAYEEMGILSREMPRGYGMGGTSRLVEPSDKKDLEEFRKIVERLKREKLLVKLGIDTRDIESDAGPIDQALQALDAALAKAKPEPKPEPEPKPDPWAALGEATKTADDKAREDAEKRIQEKLKQRQMSMRELPGGEKAFESIRSIGGSFAGREKTQIQEQTRLAKKQLDKLGTIAKSTEEMARNQLDLEMR